MPEVFVKHHPTEENNHSPEVEEPVNKDHIVDVENDPVKTYSTWTAASRPFRKKDRSYYTTIAIIVILLVLILIIAQEYLLIGVLFALTFVTYVLAFVAPEEVTYKLSSQGVTVGDHFYFWGDLASFWFTNKEGFTLLHIQTHYRFPAQLIIMIGNQNEDEIKKIVAKYLPFHEIPPKNILEHWGENLVKHFPLENPHK